MKLVGASRRLLSASFAIAGLMLVVVGARAEDEETYADVDSCGQACETAEAECQADCEEAADPDECREACSVEADACYEECE